MWPTILSVCVMCIVCMWYHIMCSKCISAHLSQWPTISYVSWVRICIDMFPMEERLHQRMSMGRPAQEYRAKQAWADTGHYASGTLDRGCCRWGPQGIGQRWLGSTSVVRDMRAQSYSAWWSSLRDTNMNCASIVNVSFAHSRWCSHKYYFRDMHEFVYALTCLNYSTRLK